MESAYLICMNCVVAATGNVLIIRTKDGDHQIPIDKIHGVDLKPPTKMFNCGSITIHTARANSSSFAIIAGISVNRGADIRLEFFKDNLKDAEKVLDYIINFQNGSGVVSSGADELIKYKQLLDMGAITQDEFDRKKRQILGT